MKNTKKTIAGAIAVALMSIPVTAPLATAQEPTTMIQEIAPIDIKEAVVDPYTLKAEDCRAILSVKPGSQQVFDLNKVFNTAQTATFQLADQIKSLPQVNGWKLSVDGNKLTVTADGNKAPLPLSFGVNVTDEQGQIVSGVLSAFTDAKTEAYTNVNDGIKAMKDATQNGKSAVKDQVGKSRDNQQEVVQEKKAPNKKGPEVDTGGSVHVGIVAKLVSLVAR